jgi:hypothetical protein
MMPQGAEKRRSQSTGRRDTARSAGDERRGVEEGSREVLAPSAIERELVLAHREAV